MNLQYSYVNLYLIIRVEYSVEVLNFAGCCVESFHATEARIQHKHNYARFKVNITMCKRLCELDEKCIGIAITHDSSVFRPRCYLYNIDTSTSRDMSGPEMFYKAHRICDGDEKPQRRHKQDPETSKGNLKTSFLNICRRIQGTCNMFHRSYVS